MLKATVTPIGSSRNPVRADACPECAVPNRLHRGVTGTWLGCAIAKVSKRVSDWPKDPERWNDPFVETTLALRAAMVDGTLGPRMETDMARYTNDEQLTLAYAIAQIVRSEDIATLAKKAGAL